jgi:hypothetical protein
MPFQSVAARRISDQGVLTHADCPDGLAEGESVTYWRKLPHSLQAAVLSATLRVSVDKRGRPSDTRLDAGEYPMSVIANGIVDWTLFDEAGVPVKWDPRQSRALIDGLPSDVLRALGDRVKADEPPALGTPEDDGSTLGEASADPS